MIKNIIFDMSEVIISGYHGVEKILEQQYAIPEEAWERQRLSKNELFLNLMRGNLSEEAYLEELLQGTNWNISIEQLKTAIRSNLNRPVPGTMKVVRELKGKYQLILLSDYVREWMKYIEERNEDLIKSLLDVWENSVKATHKFLSDEEIAQIKQYVPQALSSITNLVIATDENDNPIAFMGIEDRKLEMLFVKNSERKKELEKNY